MARKPYCPKCGSLWVGRIGGRGRCHRCHANRPWRDFTAQYADADQPQRTSNQRWRDPIPRTMDGYDE